MAWSGDVLYNQIWNGYENLDFVFPEGGALLWIDNMMVPAHAANPVGALELMDFYYRPEIAAMVTEYVLYMSPVPATKEVMLQDAQKAQQAGLKAHAKKLTDTANSPYLYPGPDFIDRTKFSRQIKTDEEAREWDSIFLPISEG